MSKYLINPPDGLLEKVIGRIQKEKRILAIKRRIALFSALFIFSAAAFIPAINVFITESSDSGFFHFANLIFTDFSIVFAYSKAFSLALLEALPVFGLLAILSVMLVFLWSSKKIFTNVKSILIINT